MYLISTGQKTGNYSCRFWEFIIVVTHSTVADQSFLKISRDKLVKMVFSSVTDPMGANLVSNLERPGGNITGVSNFVPLAPQLKMFKEILPQMQRLGFLYNPGEQNSVSLLRQLEQIAEIYGMTIISQTANQSADVPQAALALSSKVDAIFISNDSTALSALPSTIKQATLARIPVFVSDTDAVELGALAALGPNQYHIGIQTGEMMVRILKGTSIGEMGVEFPVSSELYLNKQQAQKLGIDLPDVLVKQAARVVAD